ncbi:MAG: leucine-rich repeat domain-containing protein [Oscillospiraceae bacterium]|nr:leucine-rich repeat domain-containing protein [Oscillospiraceae bacterium]
MANFTKKQIWAAFLTAAAIFSLAGCSSSDSDKTDYTEATMGVVTTTAEYTSNTEYLYIKNEDGTIAVSGYTGSEANVTVPDTIDGLKVTAIGDHAFEANWDLETITLPEGITYIGESAFMDCGSLKSVNVPETTVTIRRAAFAGCSALDNVVVPASVAQIMEETFSGCGSLKNLTIASTSVIYESWGLDKETMTELVITCPEGSQISTWANENGFATAAL